MITINNAIVVKSTNGYRAQLAYNKDSHEQIQSLWVDIPPLLNEKGEPMSKEELFKSRWNLTGTLVFGWYNLDECRLEPLSKRFESDGFIAPSALRLVKAEESDEKTLPQWDLSECPTFKKDGKDLIRIGVAGKTLTNNGVGIWLPFQGERESLSPVLGNKGIWFFKPCPA